MDSASIIFVILAILGFSVFLIAVIQKREQKKAVFRQKIAQYRYRANQATNILGNFSEQPIGPEARIILLKYCLANLNAIQKLSPTESNISNSINAIKQQLEDPKSPADKRRLIIPKDIKLLTKQVNQLSTLAKFILKINKLNIVPANTASVAINKIMALITESKICAYIAQGKNSLTKHEYVPAQRNFIFAQQMLAKISNKTERIISLEKEVSELIKTSPEMLINSLEAESSKNVVPPSNSNDQGDMDPFGPRKKW